MNPVDVSGMVLYIYIYILLSKWYLSYTVYTYNRPTFICVCQPVCERPRYRVRYFRDVFGITSLCDVPPAGRVCVLELELRRSMMAGSER